MLTWYELEHKADTYLAEKYPNRNRDYNGTDFLFDIMQNGEDGETVDGVHETHWFVPSEYHDFAGVVRAYWIPAQDEDGEDQEIGYALD